MESKNKNKTENPGTDSYIQRTGDCWRGGIGDGETGGKDKVQNFQL